MKQVYLTFKGIELGFLTEEKGAYIWVPKKEGIQEFYEKYEAATDLLLLSAIEPEVYSVIPKHFNQFVESAKRPDLAKDAGIVENDSDFEKLYKMAALDYFNDEFCIKI